MPTPALFKASRSTNSRAVSIDGKESLHIGFPSPAKDFITESIDLNHLIVRHPAATFYARVDGDSMHAAGIDSGDIIVIDRSIEPGSGDLVVCCLDGEFLLRKLKIDRSGRLLLLTPATVPRQVEVGADSNFQVWGTVTHTIKFHRHAAS